MGNRDVPLKLRREVEQIRKTCGIVEKILKVLADLIRPGISTQDINTTCHELILRHKAEPALLKYKGFPSCICTSVNQVAAHGIPGAYVLKPGDIVTLDLTLSKNGWHGDGAWTYLVGPTDADMRRLIKAAWQATLAGIQAAKAGSRMGDIGYAIEQTAKKFGCSILDQFVGHGIGRDLHEEPMVMNRGIPHQGQPIVPGMVITIEPVLALGENSVATLDDGWTSITKDGKACAQFEHTIAVLSDHTEIMTFSADSLEKYLDFPPYF